MKMQEMFKIRVTSNLCLIAFILVLQSCATFKSGAKTTAFLGESGVEHLNGRYEISSIKSKSFEYHNFLREIDRKIFKDTLVVDSTKRNYVEINILDDGQIGVNYIEDNKVVRTRYIKAKLKKNGYLYLKNKNVGSSLIPYIFGRLDVKRARFTVNENKDLVMEVSHFRGGGVFVLLFLSWNTDRYEKSYLRVE